MAAKKVSAVMLLARRFLMSKTSDGFISLIAWVSVIGVLLGVLALVVVTSVINGFEGELQSIITGMNGDLILYTRAEPFTEEELVEQKVRRVVPETEAISDSLVAELMVLGPNGPAGAVLEGLNLDRIGKVTQIPSHVSSGKLPTGDQEVALGSALADRIGVKLGDDVKLTLSLAGQSDEASMPKSATVRVVGIVRMGMYEYDSKFMFATLTGVQKLLGMPGHVSSLKIKLRRGADSRQASDQLAKSFGYPFRAKNWAQLNKNILSAIQLEKAVIAIILAVIVIVAAFNVMSTLMMLMHDKTQDIAILKAMGLSPGASFRLFCLIGVGMGAAGALMGVTLGLALNWVLDHTRFIDLPADIYPVSYLPVVVRWREIGLIALAALVISLLATLYPGWKAARRSPLEGLRYD